jgi:uncharacterized protein (TIGR03083 family)
MPSDLDYLDHLRRDSQRFSEVLATAPADAPVPTCPGWDAGDLLWHLAGVQWTWGEIVRRGLTDGAKTEKLDPGPRPEGREALRAFYDLASADLSQVLAETDPATIVWTWSTEQSAGFIRRRMAQEALIHRLDAELTAGARTPMDVALSADGVDEVLRIMYGGCPPWGAMTAVDGPSLRLQASDTGDSWLVTPARFTGTEPDGTVHEDEPDIQVAASDPGGEAGATVTGTAADLDCWLWKRPTSGEVVRDGDPSVIATFEETTGAGIQ